MKNSLILYSIEHYRITSCGLRKSFPENMREAVSCPKYKVWENITWFLSFNGTFLKVVPLEMGNPKLVRSYEVVYRKNGSEYTLLYVLASMETLRLKSFKVLEKNIIFMHQCLKEAIIAERTGKIEAYAFKKCSKLKKACLPKGVLVADEAFSDVSQDIEVVCR